MRTSLFGGASPFAHFAGLALARSGRRAEEDDGGYDKDTKRGKRSKADAEDDDPKDDDKSSKRSKADAEDDDPKDDDKSSKRSKADAEDDDPKDDDKSSKRSRADAEDDDPKDDDKSSKRSRARADEDDDDEDDNKDEMSGRSAAASARRRERARCAAIFAHPSAASNPELACSLAFETTLTRKEAVAVLRTQGGRAGADRGDRRDRADRNARLGGGGETAPTGTQAIQSSWDRALTKVGVAPRK